MSAEIVNLRKARKSKARQDKERTAAANRARFGRTRAERDAEEMASDRARRTLDGARRTPDDPGE